MAQIFDYHLFLCLNSRQDASKYCGSAFSEEVFKYLKLETKKLVTDKKIRISKAGCLGRCSIGPLMVIYPQGVWYNYYNLEDIDEIIASHIVGSELVERLLVKA